MSRRQDTNQSNDEIDYTRHDPVNIIYKIGIYGWRKRCLYLLILIITVITIINLALTIWVMHVMNFNLDGMGKLKITNKGVLLQGNAEFVKPLYVESIETRQDKAMVVQSTANVTISARNESGDTVSQLFVGNHEIVAKQKVFKVHSNDGKELLYADKDEVRFGYDKLTFANDQQTVNLTGALQTQHVRSPPFKHLELRSPTRSIYVEAPENIGVVSGGGDIFVKSKFSASFTSNKFVFDGKKIVFEDLPTMPTTGTVNNPKASEACLCPNGRMYAALSGTNCAVTADTCK